MSLTVNMEPMHAALHSYSERRAADLGLAFVEVAQELAPVGETGHLADSIAVTDVAEAGDGWVVTVTCGADYGFYVNRGTGVFVGEGRIYPRQARALVFEWNGETWALASVAGMEGTPFWTQAVAQLAEHREGPVIAATMTALVEYVSDVLVNDCDRPVPDRVLRYHGTLPHDCCTDNGFLVINYTTMFPSTTFPSSASPSQACDGIPVADLRIRYVVCWPAPDTDAAGKPVFTDDFYESCDATTAMLANVGECVQRALNPLGCASPDLTNPYVAELVEVVAGNRLRFVETSPITPQGMCAGVQWRMYAAPALGAPAS